MKIIIHRDLDIVRMAGRKIWMLGFTAHTTRILNPTEVYLYVERFTDNDARRLTLVEVTEGGNISDVLGYEPNLDDLDDESTLIFLASTEDDLFKIPEVVKIQRLFGQIVQVALDHKRAQGHELTSLFADTNTHWDDAI